MPDKRLGSSRDLWVYRVTYHNVARPMSDTEFLYPENDGQVLWYGNKTSTDMHTRILEDVSDSWNVIKSMKSILHYYFFSFLQFHFLFYVYFCCCCVCGKVRGVGRGNGVVAEKYPDPPSVCQQTRLATTTEKRSWFTKSFVRTTFVCVLSSFLLFPCYLFISKTFYYRNLWSSGYI